MCISPPLEYLVTSSQAGLENFELVRRNTIANLRKELGEVVEEWIEAETQCRLARWILECRRTQDAASDSHRSKAIDENRLPLFDGPLNSQEYQSQSSSLTALPNRSSRSPRSSSPALDALPLPSTQLSCKAKRALHFLEQQARLQTDAIAPNAYISQPGIGRKAALPSPVRNAPQHQRVHKRSQTASLFPVALDPAERSENVCARTRRFAAGHSAKRDAPKGRAVADSAEVPQIVALVRGQKLRPAPPARASMRYSPPQRKAV
ncbi:MAG: hypothetical protein ABSB66_09315 [Candidatus Acidiferrales bacterium]